MQKAIRTFIRGILTILATTLLASASVHAESESTPLFDGKTFEGWEGDLQWFRIEDGAIVAGSDKPIPHNQFLSTKATYANFELHLKVKIEGNANGGIQFRSKRVPDSTEVSGFQADFGWNFWGCLYDESRRNKTLACADETLQKEIVKKDDWNDYIIRAEGNRIQLFLNGEQTVDYVEEDDSIARDGIIAVQIHAGPASRIWYKDLSITELTEQDED